MIKNRITLKQLEAFAFVVDAGTFRAAAAALGTTQPNISSRIAALEDALGLTLLHRDAGSVRLTPRGAELLDQTRDILRGTEALLEQADRRDLVTERLRLGVTELVACTWLPDFLRALRQDYPALRVELVVDLSTRVEEALHAHQLDLAIQNTPVRTATGDSHPLTPEPYVWVAQPAQAAALPSGTDVARFFDGPVLTHARHTNAGRALHAMAADRGLDAQKIVHSSALSACIPMVTEGFGTALLPRALVAADIAAGRLAVCDADWCADPLDFLVRYDAARAPRFVARAAAIVRDLRPPTDDQ